MKAQFSLFKVRWFALLLLSALAGSSSAIELNGSSEQIQLQSLLSAELDRGVEGEADYDAPDLALNSVSTAVTPRLYRTPTPIEASATNRASASLPQIRAPPLF